MAKPKRSQAAMSREVAGQPGTTNYALSNPTSREVLAPRKLCRPRFRTIATDTESTPPKMQNAFAHQDGFKNGCRLGTLPWPDVDIPNSGPIFRIIRSIVGRRQAGAARTFRIARTGLPATTRQGTSHRLRPNRPVPLAGQGRNEPGLGAVFGHLRIARKTPSPETTPDFFPFQGA